MEKILERNFCCRMTNLTGAKILSSINFVTHSAIWIFLATIFYPQGPWFEKSILSGGVICSLGYAVILLGLFWVQNVKIILGGQAIVGLGAIVFTTGTIGVAVVFWPIWFFRPIWFAVVTYIPMQFWNGCLNLSAAQKIANPFPKDTQNNNTEAIKEIE